MSNIAVRAGLVGLLLVGACGGRTLGDKPGASGRGGASGAGGAPLRTWSFEETVNRDIDILFVIDNSRGISAVQSNLVTNFPIFEQVLRGLPLGLPGLHLAVVSSSLGAGRFEIPQCARGGDQGAFQFQPRAGCTASGLQPGQTFISDVDGVRNYSGTLNSVFACIAPLGAEGCGFEQPLAAAARALGADGQPAPAQNAGFLRPNAYLSIMIVTDEDDCSMPADSDLANPASTLVSDPLGPLTSFRCNEFGHLCNGAPPPRTHGATFVNGECVPAEGAGKLTPVATLVQQIKGLKADPNKVLVTVIAGLPSPYQVQMVPAGLGADPSMWPAMGPSCTQSPVEHADPGVRLAAFAQAFGRNAVYQTVCADSLAPGLQRIAEDVGVQPPAFCVDGPVGYSKGQPDCSAVERYDDGAGRLVEEAVPACAAGGGRAGPCWQFADGNAMACSGARVLSVPRAIPAPRGATLQLSCAPCAPASVAGSAGCR